MPKAERNAEVKWKGNLLQGAGTITRTGSGAFGNLPVTWAARTESSDGKTRILELDPLSLHQRTPLFIGSENDVFMLEKFLFEETVETVI